MTQPTDPVAAELAALRADVDVLKAAAARQAEETRRAHEWLRTHRRDDDTDPRAREEKM